MFLKCFLDIPTIDTFIPQIHENKKNPKVKLCWQNSRTKLDYGTFFEKFEDNAFLFQGKFAKSSVTKCKYWFQNTLFAVRQVHNQGVHFKITLL